MTKEVESEGLSKVKLKVTIKKNESVNSLRNIIQVTGADLPIILRGKCKQSMLPDLTNGIEFGALIQNVSKCHAQPCVGVCAKLFIIIRLSRRLRLAKIFYSMVDISKKILVKSSIM